MIYSYAGNDGLLQVQMTTVIKIPPLLTLELLWPSVRSTAHRTPRRNDLSTNTRALSLTSWATENVPILYLHTLCRPTRKNPDWALKVMVIVDWPHQCQYVVLVGEYRCPISSVTERVRYRSTASPGRESLRVVVRRVRRVPELQASALVAWRVSKEAWHRLCSLTKPRSTERWDWCGVTLYMYVCAHTCTYTVCKGENRILKFMLMIFTITRKLSVGKFSSVYIYIYVLGHDYCDILRWGHTQWIFKFYFTT
jgi:hypothetical protein